MPVLESPFQKNTAHTLTQMFTCEIREIYKNTYFEEHSGTTAFEKPYACVL